MLENNKKQRFFELGNTESKNQVSGLKMILFNIEFLIIEESRGNFIEGLLDIGFPVLPVMFWNIAMLFVATGVVLMFGLSVEFYDELLLLEDFAVEGERVPGFQLRWVPLASLSHYNDYVVLVHWYFAYRTRLFEEVLNVFQTQPAQALNSNLAIALAYHYDYKKGSQLPKTNIQSLPRIFFRQTPKLLHNVWHKSTGQFVRNPQPIFKAGKTIPPRYQQRWGS